MPTDSESLKIEPIWADGGEVPECNPNCPSYDAGPCRSLSTCKILEYEPPDVCIPEVRRIVRAERVARKKLEGYAHRVCQHCNKWRHEDGWERGSYLGKCRECREEESG